jgi:hypothetical protein
MGGLHKEEILKLSKAAFFKPELAQILTIKYC